MADPLAIVQAKLTVAEHDGANLSETMNAALSQRAGPDKFYRLVPELHLDRGECDFRLQKVADIPTADWEAQLGRVIHGLRSALDQLAYQLAILNNPNEDPPSGTEFPIFIDPEKFRAKGKGSGTYKIRGLGPTIQVEVEALQPYNTGDLTLWVLQQLSNSDKHRLGFNMNASLGSPIMRGPFWTDLEQLTSCWEPITSDKEGMVVATYKVRQIGENPKVEVQFQPTYAPIIDEGIGRPPRVMAFVIPKLLKTTAETAAKFDRFFE